MKKALFLDRDGIINVDKGYVYKIEDIEFTKGIFELLRTASGMGFDLFVVTNQSGVARGMYTEEDVDKAHSYIREKLENEGISIKKFYYCPHHPEISGTCTCRKPAAGMLKLAEKEYGINLSKSVIIGDKKSDIMTGRNAGTAFGILVRSGYEASPCKEADYTAEDIADAEEALKEFYGA